MGWYFDCEFKWIDWLWGICMLMVWIWGTNGGDLNQNDEWFVWIAGFAFDAMGHQSRSFMELYW